MYRLENVSDFNTYYLIIYTIMFKFVDKIGRIFSTTRPSLIIILYRPNILLILYKYNMNVIYSTVPCLEQIYRFLREITPNCGTKNAKIRSSNTPLTTGFSYSITDIMYKNRVEHTKLG